MKVEQIYTGCLAQGAYYIESEGEVAIIDPLREPQPYLQKAKEDGATIKYIFETHFHADFVSGHLTLAEQTNAPIIYGPTAQPRFTAEIAADEAIYPLGKVKIKVLHTPGHTMESTTFLLLDEADQPHAIFTGDTLFLGDVGRPDLAQKAAQMTKEELAGILFDSLRNKIMSLPDEVIVYPGHGAGSACGKNMMTETVDTLGNQKEMNYALRANMTKEEFIKEVTDGLLPPPGYFPLNAKLNKEGYASFDQVLTQGTKALSPAQFETLANETGAVMLDVRPASSFAKAHIPNSIFIGLEGDFAPWVGALIVDVKHPILLIAEEGKEEEAVTRLARVGFDQVLGYLEGGIANWQAAEKEIDQVQNISATELAAQYTSEKLAIFDVRKESEFQSTHVVDAQSVPLSQLNRHLAVFPQKSPFFVHCAGGYRSMIAASILKSRGYHEVVNIEGGFKAIEQTGISRTEYVCPSTL